MWGSNREQQFFIKAKRKFYSLVDESELVEFPIDVLIHACKAVSLSKSEDRKAYMEELQLALNFLNVELRESQSSTGQRIKLAPTQVTNL
jgi:hypothetical protein